jgi:hypothetical protein
MAILGELASFPNAYRRLARFVLTSDWAQDFTDYKGGASRPMNLDSALLYSEWSLTQGAYIPLRTAYKLRQGSEILAAREPSSAVPQRIQRKIAEFEASLGQGDAALLRSF